MNLLLQDVFHKDTNLRSGPLVGSKSYFYEKHQTAFSVGAIQERFPS